LLKQDKNGNNNVMICLCKVMF